MTEKVLCITIGPVSGIGIRIQIQNIWKVSDLSFWIWFVSNNYRVNQKKIKLKNKGRNVMEQVWNSQTQMYSYLLQYHEFDFIWLSWKMANK